MREATGDGMRKCAYCRRRFSKTDHLKRHERQHTGERPFRCNHCHKVYARSDVLTRHIRNHHLSNGDDTSTELPPQTRHISVGLDQADSLMPITEDPDEPVQPLAGIGLSSALDGGQIPTPPSQQVAPESMDPPLQPSLVDQDLNPQLNFVFEHDMSLDFPAIYTALNSWASPFELTNISPKQTFGLDDTGSWEPALASINHSRQSDRVQKVWPRQRVSTVVRIVQGLWHHAVRHPSDNLFAKPEQSRIPTGTDTKLSRWNMNDECRDRLVRECSAMLLPAEKYSGRLTVPGSPRIDTAEENEHEIEGLSPRAGRLHFPCSETLDMSIDVFFQRCHPAMPFLHPATFDARQMPTPLLLAVCLVGLNILNPSGAESFVGQSLGKLIRYCRLDLTYKALGKGGAQELLTSFATSLLVLRLGLSCQKSIDEHQAHMLAIQVLFIAGRHGLFHAQEMEPPSMALFKHLDSEQAVWTAWARVEALKRLILGLISIDAAYTRMLDLAANIATDKVVVILPCASALFDAPTAAVFNAMLRSGSPMTMPLVDLADDIETFLPLLTEYGLQIMLNVLILREAATRHILLHNDFFAFTRSGFVPATIYAADSKARNIAEGLVLISVEQHRTFEKHPLNALLWNYLCLALSADLRRIQYACGRRGVESSQKALVDLAVWSSTSSARRALVHAAQIFQIFSHYRLADNMLVLNEPLLSDAAMTIAVYSLLCPPPDETCATNPILELSEDIDWRAIGAKGLSVSAAFAADKRALLRPSEVTSDILSFITHGGECTFMGNLLDRSGHSARKIVLTFAHLLDETITRYQSEYSVLLRTVGDFLVEADLDEL